VSGEGANRGRGAADIAGLAARLIFGAGFIYLGWNKALHPVEFLKLVRQYDSAQNHVLLDFIAAVLPWFEVFCGLLLLTGVAVRGTALVCVLMLLPFTWMVLRRALELKAARGIPFCAVKFDCGCGTGEEYICGKLLQNGVLILLALWLVAGQGRKLALRYGLMRMKTSGAAMAVK
jgi:uncharacterized membrane protein YphA (DoxX/SURF4 family)